MEEKLCFMIWEIKSIWNQILKCLINNDSQQSLTQQEKIL